MIYGEAEQEGFAQKVSCGGGRAAERGSAAPEVDGFCLATAVQRCACCAVVAAPHRCFSYLAVEVPAAQRRRTENL